MARRKPFIFKTRPVLVQDLDQNTSLTVESDPPSKKRKACDTAAEYQPEAKVPRADDSATKPRAQKKSRRAERRPKDQSDALRRIAKAGDASEFKERYEQQEILGAGGFGSVFAGVRRADLLPVAIKHIPRDTVQYSPVVIGNQCFQVPVEVMTHTRATPRLDCVGQYAAVSLLEWFEVDQEVILVMERPLSCVDLFKYCLDNAPMPEDQGKVIVRQLLEALTDLHSKGIFHRDIKMENVLIQTLPDGPRVRIIDFGCGCNIKSQPYFKYSGTQDYAPPEYYRTHRYSAGPTSVWQLGAVMYELFRTDEDEEFTTMDYMKGRLSQLSHLSPECHHFLQACLTMDPVERFTLEQLSTHPWFSVSASVTTAQMFGCRDFISPPSIHYYHKKI